MDKNDKWVMSPDDERAFYCSATLSQAVLKLQFYLEDKLTGDERGNHIRVKHIISTLRRERFTEDAVEKLTDAEVKGILNEEESKEQLDYIRKYAKYVKGWGEIQNDR